MWQNHFYWLSIGRVLTGYQTLTPISLKTRAKLWRNLLFYGNCFYLLKQKVAGQLFWKVNSVCYWSWITICHFLQIWLKAMAWIDKTVILEHRKWLKLNTVKISCQQSLEKNITFVCLVTSQSLQITRRIALSVISSNY